MLQCKARLSLIGCCVIRDIFGLHENDGGYCIVKYVQNVNPISAVTKSPLLRKLANEDELIFQGQKDFFVRCQKLEMEKGIFDYVATSLSDYLIIDVAEFRRKLYYFPYNDGWFSENYVLRSLFDGYIASGIIPADYEVLSPLDISIRERDNLLSAYCDKLLGLCDSDKIILIDVKSGGCPMLFNKYLTDEEIWTAQLMNERIDYAFEFVKGYIDGIHIVEFPDYVTLDSNHKWGRNLLHFVKEYYDYALEAIDMIIGRFDSMSEEKTALAELKKKYEIDLKCRYSIT